MLSLGYHVVRKYRGRDDGLSDIGDVATAVGIADIVAAAAVTLSVAVAVAVAPIVAAGVGIALIIAVAAGALTLAIDVVVICGNLGGSELFRLLHGNVGGERRASWRWLLRREEQTDVHAARWAHR